MADVFETPFWSRFVPRLGRSCPAVFHLVVGLGSAHEMTYKQTQASLSGDEAYRVDWDIAIKQCNKSIHLLLADPSASSLLIQLTACLLLQAFTNILTGRRGYQWSIASFDLLARRSKQIPKAEAAIVDEILGPATRYDQGLLGAAIDPMYALKQALLDEGIPPRREQPSCPSSFRSLVAARDSLHDLLVWVLSNLTPERESNSFILEEDVRENIETAFRHWTAALDKMTEAGDGRDDAAVCSLKAYRHFAMITIEAMHFEAEKEFDALLPKFEELLQLCQKANAASSTSNRPKLSSNATFFMFGLGISTFRPLLLIGLRCRDAGLRRQALGAIETTSKHKVGPVWTNVVSMLVEFAIATEEQGLKTPLTVDDIPESNRIRLHSLTSFYHSTGKAFRIEYMRPPCDHQATSTIERSWIRRSANDHQLFKKAIKFYEESFQTSVEEQDIALVAFEPGDGICLRQGGASYHDGSKGRFVLPRPSVEFLLPPKIHD